MNSTPFQIPIVVYRKKGKQSKLFGYFVLLYCAVFETLIFGITLTILIGLLLSFSWLPFFPQSERTMSILIQNYFIMGFILESVILVAKIAIYQDFNKLLFISLINFFRSINSLDKKTSNKIINNAIINHLKPRNKEVILLLMTFLILSSTLIAPAITNNILQSHIQRNDIYYLSTSITNSYNDEYQKINALIDWQKAHISNSFGSEIRILHSGISFVPAKRVEFSINNDGSDRGNWTIINRAGACGNNALAFMSLANLSDIPVRTIFIEAEDHSFNEVFIDGRWVIVDITNDTSYDISPTFYKNNWWTLFNISYAYARYPNNTIEGSLTNRYTNVSNLLIMVVDNSSLPIKNATIKIFSNNRKDRLHAYTNVSGITDDNGQFAFTIGEGNYTIEAKNDTLSGKQENIIINGNSNETITIILKDKNEDVNSTNIINTITSSPIFNILVAILMMYFILKYNDSVMVDITYIFLYAIVLMTLIKFYFII